MLPARAPGEDLPVGPAKTARVRAIFDTIAPRYDVVNRMMTLGLDTRWRQRTVDALGIPGGVIVVDLACGTGDLSGICRRQGQRVIGADFSPGMLAANRSGTALVQADAVRLPFPDRSVDAVVCGFALRNFTDVRAAMTEAARVLRAGGRLGILEVGAPPPGLMRVGFRLWFEHVVPALGAMLSDAAAYRYLPRSTVYLPDPDELRATLVRIGFSTVGHRLLHGGLSQLFTATRSGLPPGAVAAG